MKGTFVSKIGKTSNTARWWAEGTKLLKIGFNAGDKINRVFDIRNKRIVICKNPKGRFLVSKRTRKSKVTPILDITNAALGSLFKIGQVVKAVGKNGRMVIVAICAYLSLAPTSSAGIADYDLTNDNGAIITHTLLDFERRGCLGASFLFSLHSKRIPAVCAVLRAKGYELELINERPSYIVLNAAITHELLSQIGTDYGYSRTRFTVTDVFQSQNHSDTKAGGLFHCLGVLDHAVHSGLSEADCSVSHAYAVELEGSYLDVSLANNPIWSRRSQFYSGDIALFDRNEFAKHQANVIVAGIPCTGASIAGRAKLKLANAESHPAAGGMFYFVLSHIAQNGSLLGIFENVTQYKNTESFKIIKETLVAWGFTVDTKTIDSAQFGTLEARKRLIVVATHKHWLGKFSLATFSPKKYQDKTVGDILDTSITPDDKRYKEYAYLEEKEKRDLAAGKGFKQSKLTPESKHSSTLTRGYQKVRSVESRLLHPTNPSLTRLFTTKEHARLKSIPEYLIKGVTSETLGHQMLGQSVDFMAFKLTVKGLLSPRSAQVIQLDMFSLLDSDYAA